MTKTMPPSTATPPRKGAGLRALALSLLAATVCAQAPGDNPAAAAWQAQVSPVAVELRGLAVVSDRVAWASGAKGSILRTVDGETWAVLKVAGAETLDFRDIEAWDEKNAIAMSIGAGEASNVYKTTDGGTTWRRVFANPDPTGFWDAITFWDREHGALFGDPVRGRFQVYTTGDGGESWQPVPEEGMPAALENEGGFAASGSCLVAGPGRSLAFVTGGASEARVFVSTNGGRSFRVSTSPVPATAASKGLFSIAWLNESTLLSVGGDYKEPALEGIKASLSDDIGVLWKSVRSDPGFLSSVVPGPDKDSVVAVGLAGTGFSADLGKTWTTIDRTPYNTAGFAPRGGPFARAGWAVGPKGVIARWSMPLRPR
ncbi:MAG: hypothetical protein JJE39_15760 [Vicinamibacteria bacterium]|nr:hypothetical protein [Vicinamibacteria bacterium]